MKTERKGRFILLIILSFLCFHYGNGQEIHVNVENKPLQEVFLDLRDEYQIQFSYNSKHLRDCFITKKQSYSTPEELLTDILTPCQLSFIKSGEIFIIQTLKETGNQKIIPAKYYLYSGKIIDSENKEALPSAYIQSGSKYFSTDVTGSFSLKSKDSVYKIRISYLGYYQIDTTLTYSNNLRIALRPSTIGLKEVLVQSHLPIFDMHLGEHSGEIKINSKMAKFLPGSQNNTIYNMLRLQSGIMAAGEQSNDFTIWGSYQGQNLVTFDHITLFNFTSYDNNISVVNALLVKDISVKKGGFNAEYSNRVGGIVDITGKNGIPDEFHGQLNINNQAVSAWINIPIAKKTALQTSFRQSFYHLYQKEDNISTKGQKEYIQPNYIFGDFNVKLSGRLYKRDDFYLSLLGSNDSYALENLRSEQNAYSRTSEQKKQQYGSSFFYNKHWKNGGYSNAIISFSSLNSNLKNTFTKNKSGHGNSMTFTNYNANSVSEFSIKGIHHLALSTIHQASFGIDYYYNSVGFIQDTMEVNLRSKDESSHRIGGYIKDEISITKKFSLQPGLRIDFLTYQNKLYLQPRLNAIYRINDKWNMNLAMGIYNQFISKNTLIDPQNNYLFFWNISNNKNIPVVSSQHFVFGSIYNNSYLKFSIEGYYKRTQKISLFITNNETKKRTISSGNANTIGLDLYAKAMIKKHEVWIAYTLSQTLEHFSYFPNDEYQLAPQNQTHEVKTAAVLNFSPFFFSANYVYGSGLQFTSIDEEDLDPIPYNRFDLAFIYKFNPKKMNIELGFSILNVLNNYNVAYDYFTNYPDNSVVYSRAMPFTPLLNLKIGF